MSSSTSIIIPPEGASCESLPRSIKLSRGSFKQAQSPLSVILSEPIPPSSSEDAPSSISNPRAAAVILVCLTAFVVSNSAGLSVNLLVPVIQRDLRIEASNLQWISNGYPLGFGSCLLLFGRLADAFGHKLFIQLGCLIFSLSSLGCGLSQTALQLSIFRVLQGLGAAAIAPSLIGVLGTLLPPGTTIKRAGFAALSAGAPLGASFGLLVGGFITAGTRWRWRSFFFLSMAVSGVVLLLITVIVPGKKLAHRKSKGKNSIDWLGGLLIISGLILMTYALASSSKDGWGRPRILAPFFLSLLILSCFVYWQNHLETKVKTLSTIGPDSEKSSIEPILKLSLFTRQNGTFSVVLLVVAFLWFGFVAQNFFFHQYLQDYLNLSLTRSVVRFIPMVIVGVLLNIAVGFLSPIIPAQILMIIGCCGTGASCLLSALMNTSASYWSFNFASIALAVVGADFVFACGTIYGSNISSKSEQAVTGGVFHTFAQMGNAIGLSIATLVQTTRARSRELGVIITDDLTSAPPEAFLFGLRAGFWTCFASLALASLLCVTFLGKMGYVGKEEEKEEQKMTNSKNQTSKKRVERNLEANIEATKLQYPNIH
ncbi:hypothetical protein O181_038139 [Austropuccinia psidii MF-1]|uniref:Major facilitator superfamily (MFS) profile domain-containing protein n=1 Tax=Austropuccinia psidii MF-1 TaxID=1389203 RepID=A0A9Q3D7S2_9BASI|nr:hypothetical protein [Austropuccinia psidii MF-1]